MKISVLIPSFLEKRRLTALVNTLLKDKPSKNIQRIIIVTPNEVKLPKSRKIVVIKERKRKGKSYAIKIGLKHINTSLVLLLTSDIRIRKNFLQYLLSHLKDPTIGAVVGRPIADKNSKIYKFSKIIWDLHHLLCLHQPKGTEIMLFRKIFKDFPLVSADEVFIEYKIRKAGYKIVYEPRAYGYTKTPYTLLQFFRQRRRSFNGHLQIKERYKFETSSMKISLLLKIVLEYLRKEHSLKTFFNLLIVIFIEILARICATIDAKRNKYEIIWERSLNRF
ncbi:MAG: glycosyltransferase [Candidatus Aenigmarchaeota archaeon]|nr:glycosyltransferase [Candidatus Aenigmarchaeota archaeon]